MQTTLSDIIRLLGSHFNVELMHRKAEAKAIVADVIGNMIDEEESTDPSRDGENPCYAESGGRQESWNCWAGKHWFKVAKRLEAFGCIISYLSRKKKPVSYPFYCDVHELAAKCDVLVICCSLIDQTRHLINKEVLLALGKGLIINIARGTIINEMELVQCLDQGEIAGAGLDVFENEPNVPEELFSLDNVVLSRHVTFYTEDSFKDLYELISGNVEALFLNKPLLSPVLDD